VSPEFLKCVVITSLCFSDVHAEVPAEGRTLWWSWRIFWQRKEGRIQRGVQPTRRHLLQVWRDRTLGLRLQGTRWCQNNEELLNDAHFTTTTTTTTSQIQISFSETSSFLKYVWSLQKLHLSPQLILLSIFVVSDTFQLNLTDDIIRPLMHQLTSWSRRAAADRFSCFTRDYTSALKCWCWWPGLLHSPSTSSSRGPACWGGAVWTAHPGRGCQGNRHTATTATGYAC